MKIRSHRIQLFLLQVAVIALKIPFLTLGFGPEEDAWGHVYNIIEIFEQGHYIVSRLPGHPAYEALMFLLFPLIEFPFIINVLSALAAAFAIREFYRIAVFIGIKRPVLWTLAFALMPAFFLGSTYAIDYSFTIWLILLSTRMLLKRRYVSAGLAIGLATAFRITSLAMLLPAVLYLYMQKSRFRNYLLILLSSAAVSLVFYTPAIHQYGIGFFDYHKPPGPGFLKAFYKLTFGAIGIMGVAGCILLVINVAKNSIGQVVIGLKNPFSIYLLSGLMLFVLSYLMLTEKSAFAIPIYTFLFLILGTFENKGYQDYGLAMMCISLFAFGIQFIHPFRGANPLSYSISVQSADQEIQFSPHVGLYFSELQKRKNKLKYANAAYETLAGMPPSQTAVITGWWYAQLKTMEWLSDEELPVKLVYYVNEKELEELVRQGYQFRHLEDLHEVNDRLKNTNIQLRSEPITISYDEQ
jgi:hypothetical protein